MGMSETGIRAMEAGGQFLGGLAGGAAGVKGVHAVELRNLDPALGGLPYPVARNVAGMPTDFQSEYAAAKAAGWQKPDGQTWWPPNNGGVGTPDRVSLPPGTALDRYGGEGGSYVSPQGASFPERAMPGTPPTSPPNNYTVLRDLPADKSPIAPWFDQPGNGTQYKLVPPDDWTPQPGERWGVGTAVDEGYLERH